MNICAYCPHPALAICDCRRPGVILCNEHIAHHKSKLPTLRHVLRDYPLVPDPNAKRIIIDKLTVLKQDCERQMQELQANGERIKETVNKVFNQQVEILRNIYNKVDEKSTLLRTFLVDLNSIINFVDAFTEFTPKAFCTPLEHALKSETGAEAIAHGWKGPQVVFTMPDFDDFVVYLPSNIYQSISSYNYAVTLSDEKLYFKFPKSRQEIINSNFDKSSRCLKVSEDTVLITGGAKSMGLSYSINLKRFSVEHYPLLGIKRKNHAMAWIDNLPAVIGGQNASGRGIDNVEVLESNKWIRKASIKRERFNFTACNYGNKLYIIGGIQNNRNCENTIEVYYNNIWTILDTLPEARIYDVPAVYNNGNLILLLGNNGGVGIYNLDTAKYFSRLQNTENYLFSTQNNCKISFNCYKLLGHSGDQLFKYYLIL
jgi:Kelch motif